LISLLSQIDKARVVEGSADPRGSNLIINATPMGMRATDPLPIDVTGLDPSMFVGDVITVPEVSPLLTAARALGCQTLTGAEMYAGVLSWMDRFFI
jgi:shikimate dehydrogenase